MPDFLPEDIDAYVERAKRLDQIMDTSDDANVENGSEQLAEWCVYTAEAMMEATGLSGMEAVASTTAIAAGVLAAWYKQLDEDDES